MDFDRRLALASLAEDCLPDVHQSVVESWADLMPIALRWTTAERRRAHAAARAALEGLATVFAQGDLDETDWRRTRETVYGRGHASPDEVDELLRTVRIIGVELLLDRLHAELSLSPEERWGLQTQARDYCEALHRPGEDLDASTVDALLAELESDGPDLR
jgi:hypothetical protein